MKTIFRSLGLGALLTGVMAVGAFAQEPAICAEAGAADAQTALQDKIRETYAKDKKAAIDAGKQLLEKYGQCQFSAEFIAWLNPLLPKWEQSIQAAADAAARKAIIDRFDAGIAKKDWDAAYAAGNEFVTKYPNDPIRTNIVTQMGLIGLYESFPPKSNYKYNDQTIKYAQMALSEIKGGAKPVRNNQKGVGVFGGPLFEASKEDTISELNYAIAYINFWAKKDHKAALPYYYEAVQQPGIHKDDPYIYDALGGYYVAGAAPIGVEIAKMIETLKTLPTEEEKAKLDTEIKAKIALYNGYLERAMDSYARAHKAYGTLTTPYAKQRKDELYKELQNLYKRRFDKDAGLDAYIATTVAKPLPNPTSAVQPVVDEPVPTDTNTNTTTSAPAAAPAKPVATTPTKPLSTNRVKNTATAAKKKGTR